MKESELQYFEFFEGLIFHLADFTSLEFNEMIKDFSGKDKKIIDLTYKAITKKTILGKKLDIIGNNQENIQHEYLKRFLKVTKKNYSLSRISAILRVFCENSYQEEYISEALMPGLKQYTIPQLTLGGMFFYKQKTKKKISEECKKMKGYLPKDITAFFPTVFSVEREYYKLLIPKNIVNAFNITKDSKYYLGLENGCYNKLFFIRKNKQQKKFTQQAQKNAKSICTIDPSIARIDDINDKGIYNFHASNIFVILEDTITDNSETSLYFEIPQDIFKISKLDCQLLPKDAHLPITPAYVISYDLLGNLIYHRIAYAPQTILEKHSSPAIFLSEIEQYLDA